MFYDIITLEAKVRAAHLAVETAHGTALDRALEAGDVLLEIFRRNLAKHGERKALYVKTCGSNRTGQIYVRLAEHRPLLEANTQSLRVSTITAALRLISKNDLKPARPKSDPKPDRDPKLGRTNTTKSESATPDCSRMTDADWTAALEVLGFERLLQVLPKGWHARLNSHALSITKSKLPAVQEELGFVRKQLTQLQRNHPRLVH
jgi:hypothetical protein